MRRAVDLEQHARGTTDHCGSCARECCEALLLPRAEAAPPAAPRGGAPPPAAHWATSRRVALALVAGVLALAACASATTRGLVDPAPVLARLGARNRVRRVDERDAAIDAPASPPRAIASPGHTHVPASNAADIPSALLAVPVRFSRRVRLSRSRANEPPDARRRRSRRAC